MKLSIFITAAAALALASCQKKESRLDVALPDATDGQTVELLNYADSASLGTASFAGGSAAIILPEGSEGALALVRVDGRTKGYYLVEGGQALFNGETEAATGTPGNDSFSALLLRLDSLEEAEMPAERKALVEESYNANKDNGLGLYLAQEWSRSATTAEIDSLLAVAPEGVKTSPRVKRYRDMAVLQEATAPGQPFTDFSAVQPDGETLSLSSFVEPGKYTLVDFWASWCPWCIKGLPAIKEIYDTYKDKGLIVVGVAVRDDAEATRGAVDKYGITWPVLYNAERKPYDIYGMTGIPHLMLIGPDGKILSRGEGARKIRERLEQAFSAQ